MKLNTHNHNNGPSKNRLLLAVMVGLVVLLHSTIASVTASVFMPYTTTTTATTAAAKAFRRSQQQQPVSKADLQNMRLAIRRQPKSSLSSSSMDAMAMAIPGYGVAEQVIIGGFGNFLSIYNLVITGRILLSWFPQAASVGALQPIYAITDPYLNLFRNIIPPLFGLDFSPILAFVLLNFLTNATAAVGCEIPSTATMNMFANNYRHSKSDMYQRPSCSLLTSNEKSQEQKHRFVAWKMSRNL